MNKLKLLIGCAIVGIAVAVTYFLFEGAVHHSSNYIWDTMFDSEDNRILVLPLALVLGFIFFAAQHILDRKSENHESHSLGGEAISPTIRNIAIILFVGFLSLVAGASLGPEAVLVPACTTIGAYIGVKLYKQDSQAIKALTAAGIMALFTAFFHSYFVGILSVLIVTKQSRTKLSPQLLIIAAIASVSSYLTLQIIDPSSTSNFNLPDLTWKLAIIDLFAAICLLAAGYISTFALKYLHSGFVAFRQKVKLFTWWHLAFVSGFGIGVLYLLGGPLVQFTGNQSIEPLVKQATSLGVAGVLVIFIIKLIVIAWSKAMGYRGGLIFPMVFVASTLAVLAQLLVSDVNLGIALFAALIGILAAEKHAKILL